MSDIIQKTEIQSPIQNEIFTKETTYKVDGCSIIVTPIFKENSNETLGTILLRLMTCDE